MYDYLFLQVVAGGCWLSLSEKHYKRMLHLVTAL